MEDVYARFVGRTWGVCHEGQGGSCIKQPSVGIKVSSKPKELCLPFASTDEQSTAPGVKPDVGLVKKEKKNYSIHG